MPALHLIKSPAAYGELSTQMKDHIYHVPDRGQIFTTPWIAARVSMRFYAVISLTARRSQFSVRVGSTTQLFDAVAIKPSVDREFIARDVRLVSFHLDPRHPDFRAFRRISSSGCLALDRNAFAEFDADLDAAYHGQLHIAAASRLFDNIVAATRPSLPSVRPLDFRAVQAREILDDDPDLTFEALADRVGVSYDRMSHMFTDHVGLSFRSYQLWRKLRRVTALLSSGRSLTHCAHAAGFADSAHLSRTFLQVYGAPPSYFLNRDKVAIFGGKTRAGAEPLRDSSAIEEVRSH